MPYHLASESAKSFTLLIRAQRVQQQMLQFQPVYRVGEEPACSVCDDAFVRTTHTHTDKIPLDQ